MSIGRSGAVAEIYAAICDGRAPEICLISPNSRDRTIVLSTKGMAGPYLRSVTQEVIEPLQIFCRRMPHSVPSEDQDSQRRDHPTTWLGFKNHALLDWVAKIHWPPSGRHDERAEISWAELLNSFRPDTKVAIPVPRPGGDWAPGFLSRESPSPPEEAPQESEPVCREIGTKHPGGLSFLAAGSNCSFKRLDLAISAPQLLIR